MNRHSLLPLSLSLFVLGIVSGPFSASTAWAQKDGRATVLEDATDEDEDDEFEPDTVELSTDPNAPMGAGENPDAVPEFGVSADPDAVDTAAESIGYPMAVTERPITLLEGMFRVALDLPSIASPVQLRSQLVVSYGINSQIEISLGYGPGTVSNAAGYKGYNTGKAISVEGRYLIKDWLAAQLSVPMYVDPFAMGITVGVPMKFRMFGKVALVFGQDLMTFKLYRFAPVLSDTIYNEDRVADLATNTTIDDGELRLLGGVIYQYRPNMSFFTEIGVVAPDFSETDPVVPLRVTLTYSPYGFMDLACRLGFNNLDRATDEFGLMLSTALRI